MIKFPCCDPILIYVFSGCTGGNSLSENYEDMLLFCRNFMENIVQFVQNFKEKYVANVPKKNFMETMLLICLKFDGKYFANLAKIYVFDVSFKVQFEILQKFLFYYFFPCMLYGCCLHQHIIQAVFALSFHPLIIL